MLVWEGTKEIGIGVIPVFRGQYVAPFAALAGALLALTRARIALWITGGVTCAVILLVGYTPLVTVNLDRLIETDPLRRVESVVVLASDIQNDGELTPAAQWRLLEAYEILIRGHARRLVLTRLRPPKKSYLPAVRSQMQMFGLDYPVEETAPISNTRDEAVAVSALASERGWDRVILVTDPAHTRRAKATFRKAGLEVLCAPCKDRNYDLSSMEKPGDRLQAFGDWLYESVGFLVYRVRGWI